MHNPGVFTLLLLLAPAGAATAQLAVTLEREAVVVEGVTPGGEVVGLRVSRSPIEGGARVVTRAEEEVDGDLDGAVRFELTEALPLKAVWFAVDRITGAFALAVPAGFEARGIDPAVLTVTPGSGGALDRLRAARRSLAVLLVRPGVGAWRGWQGDGGESDADRVPDGAVTAALTDLSPVGTSPPPPEALLTGDLIVVVDPDEMDVLAVRLTSRTGGFAPVAGGR